MLIFYIVCGCVVFAVSGVILHVNRMAIYRRRIIRHFANLPEHSEKGVPFVLTEAQEKRIKQCFLNGDAIQLCIDRLDKK